MVPFRVAVDRVLQFGRLEDQAWTCPTSLGRSEVALGSRHRCVVDVVTAETQQYTLGSRQVEVCRAASEEPIVGVLSNLGTGVGPSLDRVDVLVHLGTATKAATNVFDLLEQYRSLWSRLPLHRSTQVWLPHTLDYTAGIEVVDLLYQTINGVPRQEGHYHGWSLQTPTTRYLAVSNCDEKGQPVEATQLVADLREVPANTQPTVLLVTGCTFGLVQTVLLNRWTCPERPATYKVYRELAQRWGQLSIICGGLRTAMAVEVDSKYKMYATGTYSDSVEQHVMADLLDCPRHGCRLQPLALCHHLEVGYSYCQVYRGRVYVQHRRHDPMTSGLLKYLLYGLCV